MPDLRIAGQNEDLRDSVEQIQNQEKQNVIIESYWEKICLLVDQYDGEDREEYHSTLSTTKAWMSLFEYKRKETNIIEISNVVSLVRSTYSSLLDKVMEVKCRKLSLISKKFATIADKLLQKSRSNYFDTLEKCEEAYNLSKNRTQAKILNEIHIDFDILWKEQALNSLSDLLKSLSPQAAPSDQKMIEKDDVEKGSGSLQVMENIPSGEVMKKEDGDITSRAHLSMMRGDTTDSRTELRHQNSVESPTNSSLEESDSEDESSEDSDQESDGALEENSINEEEEIEDEILSQFEEQLLEKASTKAVIEPGGGEIELCGCKLKFPPGALEKDTEVEITVDNNPQNYPKECIAITPILGCKPSMKFGVDVKVTMKVLCSPHDPNEELQGTVVCRKKQHESWQKLCNLTLPYNNDIEFEVSHFCDHMTVTSGENKAKLDRHLLNDVYYKRDTLEVYSVFWSDEKNHTEGDEILKNNWVPALPSCEEIFVPFDHVVKVRMRCCDQKNGGRGKLRVKCAGKQSFGVGEVLKRRSHKLSFKLRPVPEEKYDIDMSYRIDEIPRYFTIKRCEEGVENGSNSELSLSASSIFINSPATVYENQSTTNIGKKKPDC